MTDLFGNEIRVGQQVAYIHNGSSSRAVAFLRIGMVLKILERSIAIRSEATNSTITRFPNEIIVNNAPLSREAFLEGEDHNK